MSPDQRRAHARSRRTHQMTTGPIGITLARMAGPMVIAMISMIGFSLVDTFFIGQLGTAELAAVSFTFPVILFIGSISMGIGTGATSAIARAIGEGDEHRIKRLTTDSILLGVILTVVFAVGGLLTIDPLFRLLGADAKTLPFIREYMLIWYLGVPAVVVPQIGNSAIRATGDTKTTAWIMMSAMLVNLALDPILIFGFGPVPALGVAGAAIATVVARFVSLGVSVYVLWLRERMIAFERPALAEVVRSWRAVLSIGVPASLTQLIVPLSTGVITRLVAASGVAAVAGFGVATRLEMFAVFTITALGTVLIPFVGQNWGAGNDERARGGVRIARRFALGWGAAMWVLALVFGRSVSALFNSDPAVIAASADYLWIVGASFGLQGLVIVNTSAFNAIDKPIDSMVVSLVRMFALYVPFALVGNAFWGLTGIWYAAAAANVLSGILSSAWFDRVMRAVTQRRAEDAAPQPAIPGDAPPA